MSEPLTIIDASQVDVITFSVTVESAAGTKLVIATTARGITNAIFKAGMVFSKYYRDGDPHSQVAQRCRQIIGETLYEIHAE